MIASEGALSKISRHGKGKRAKSDVVRRCHGQDFEECFWSKILSGTVCSEKEMHMEARLELNARPRDMNLDIVYKTVRSYPGNGKPCGCMSCKTISLLQIYFRDVPLYLHIAISLCIFSKVPGAYVRLPHRLDST